MAPSTDMLLGIYLNDHLAGSTAGLELCRRAWASNRGSELGDLLAKLVSELEAEREALVGVMSVAGISPHPLKPRLAWVAEKLGRLKLNGQLRGYSPLSRVVELEGLSIGAEGKSLLWRSLGSRSDARMASFDFDALEAQARRQRDELEPFRLGAVAEACGA